MFKNFKKTRVPLHAIDTSWHSENNLEDTFKIKPELLGLLYLYELDVGKFEYDLDMNRLETNDFFPREGREPSRDYDTPDPETEEPNTDDEGKGPGEPEK